MRTTAVTTAVTAAAALVAVTLGACGGQDGVARTCSPEEIPTGGPVRIAATVAPITDVVAQLVAGTPTEVVGVVPAGRDSHTFEPSPGTVRSIAEADVLFANGLDLELPTIDAALTTMRDGSVVCELGNATVPEDEYLYDRSFPESAGSPNPHVWLVPGAVREYADVALDVLVAADPDRAEAYRANHAALVASARELDAWVSETLAGVPPERRVLLTYHDAYAYFSEEYGWEVVAAVQPSSFDEPSPREVAAVIEQVRATGVPVVFGSEVYPSPVLERIAAESGARYVADLRDDVLPGEPGDPEHSWQGLIRENVTTIVGELTRDLGDAG